MSLLFKITLGAVLGLMALLITVAVATTFASENYNQHIQVTICHATGSHSNPYVKLTVDDNAVDGVGNSDHNRSGHQDGEDIIPPGSWDLNGRNWDSQGQAIYRNNCEVPEITPTPTVTPTPTITPTETPTPTLTPTVTLTDEGGTDKCPNNDGKFSGVQTSIPDGVGVNDKGNCYDLNDPSSQPQVLASVLPATGPSGTPMLIAFLMIAVGLVIRGGLWLVDKMDL